ncbi:MAG: hypothetical protein ACOX6N_05405 [Patescibacteria group bacterium]
MIAWSIATLITKKKWMGKMSIVGPWGHAVHLASQGISISDQIHHGIEKRGNVRRYSSAIPTETTSEPFTQGGSYDFYKYDYGRNNEDDYFDPDF